MTEEITTAKTPEELLQTVNEAIIAVTSGAQSYKIGSRSVTRANITELKNLRNELAAEVEAKKAGSGIFRDTYLASFEGR